MESTTLTTPKQKRPRIATGTIVTSTNVKTRRVINLLNSMDIQIVKYFNPINYNNIGYRFANP